MSIFKTTEHIFNNPWESKIKSDPWSGSISPPPVLSDRQGDITIEDVNLWEQIYFEPGLVGLYVSWDPQREFYLLTYNMFLSKEHGYEIFRGEQGVEQIINKFSKWNIPLKQFTIKY